MPPRDTLTDENGGMQSRNPSAGTIRPVYPIHHSLPPFSEEPPSSGKISPRRIVSPAITLFEKNSWKKMITSPGLRDGVWKRLDGTLGIRAGWRLAVLDESNPLTANEAQSHAKQR